MFSQQAINIGSIACRQNIAKRNRLTKGFDLFTGIFKDMG